MDPVLQDANSRIQSALDHLKVELSSIRAGRANPSLIENVPVKVYGGMMKLLEVGTISAPQPALLTIQVWDAEVVLDVVKSIQEVNLGLNPSYEGQTIKLPIPPLTTERREEFKILAHQKMETVKIEVRQIRQDVREGWQRQQTAGEFGEDDFNHFSRLLQELVDKAGAQIDEMGKAREEELSEI